jgi:hypothetical protein
MEPLGDLSPIDDPLPMTVKNKPPFIRWFVALHSLCLSSSAIKRRRRVALFISRDRLRNNAKLLIVKSSFEWLIGTDDIDAAGGSDG